MRHGTNMSSVKQDLQAAISRIEGVLPEDSDSQVITGSLDDFSVLQLSVTDDSASGQLVERFQTTAVPALEQIDGVRAVEIAGSPVPQVQSTSLINLDKLADAGPTTADITTALRAVGAVVAAGSLRDDNRDLSVTVGERLSNVSVPFAATGVLLALLISNTPLGVPS